VKFPNWINKLYSNQTFHLLIVFILASIILFSHLSEGGTTPSMRTKAGKCSLRGTDVRFNGALNFEYPPMFIWIEALSPLPRSLLSYLQVGKRRKRPSDFDHAD
jgi:hypothetical protein